MKHRSPSPIAASKELGPSWLRDWHCLAFLGVMICFFFREIILQNAFFWEDFFQFYPYRSFASAAFSRGEIPLWNPYTFMGMPFAADITGTVFYLPHLLLVPLVSGGKLGVWPLEMYIVAHVFLSGVTMFYCAKHFGASRMPATFSALTYMFSGFMILHVIHLVTICQLAWLPLAVLLFSRTLREFSPRHMVLSGFVLSLVVCGGHIQISFYCFGFLFAFFLVEFFHLLRTSAEPKKRIPLAPLARLSGLAAGVIVIAIALSAIQLLPTSEMGDLSARAVMSFERSTEGQLHWQQLLTLLIPKIFGSANALGGENPRPFWGPAPYWGYWESAIYVGIVALAFALFSLAMVRTRRDVAFLAGAGLFALLYALGDNVFVHRFFFEWIPGFDKFRAVGRWGFLLTFVVSILSGLGVQRFLADRTSSRQLRNIFLSACVLSGIIVVGTNAGVFDELIHWQAKRGALNDAPQPAVFALAKQVVSNESIIALAVSLGGLALIFGFMRRKFSALTGVILLFLLQYVDVYLYGFSQNNGKTDPTEYFARNSKSIAPLLEEGKSEYFRVNTRNASGMLIDRSQGMLDPIFMTEGYSQLALQRRFPPSHSSEAMFDLLNTKYRARNETVMVQGRPQVMLTLARSTTYLPRAFFVYHYVLFRDTEAESTYMASEHFNPRTTVALREHPGISLQDTALVENWSAVIRSYEPERISLTVRTPKQGILVLSEMFYPGWIASVDGVSTPVFRADWSLRAVSVEAGEHTVEFRFVSETFVRGATVSVSAFVACAVTLAGLELRRRKKIGRKPVNPHDEVAT